MWVGPFDLASCLGWLVNHLLRRSLALLLFGAAALLCGSPASADNIQLSCPSCVGGGTSLVHYEIDSTAIAFSFIDVANQTFTGNAFIAILVPTGGVAPTLTGGSLIGTESFTSGDLGTVLGQDFSGYNLSTFQSASEQAGVDPAGYTVYDFSVGNNATLGPSGAGIAGLVANNVAVGSVIVGYLDPPGNTYQTPLSESITAAPEPSTLFLLGVGLLMVLCIARRLRVA